MKKGRSSYVTTLSRDVTNVFFLLINRVLGKINSFRRFVFNLV